MSEHRKDVTNPRRERLGSRGDTHANKSMPGAAHIRILGVDYLHIQMANGDDLYVTRYGVPFAETLKPRNWYHGDWFQENRRRLPGSSTVYRVRTKSVNGTSKDLVVKWCRVGQDVPAETFAGQDHAEFNSPFEEFSLVTEMRNSRRESPGVIRTHRPLAIYCPARRVELWKTGRREYKIERKKAKHRDVELDAFRHYILIYEWVKGVDVTQTALSVEGVRRLTLKAAREIERKGFRVADRKPHHLIVRVGRDDLPRRRRRGEIPYALVDFELLQRTQERELCVEQERRAQYLLRQRDRFQIEAKGHFPDHLRQVSVFGVPYVYGHAESTKGALWVVGRDPELFDYFQPERWMWTPRDRLSGTHEVYHTRTKDNIHLVWKVSRLGEEPVPSANDPHAERIAEHGFNSPFEEFSFAVELAQKNVNAIYPRAIYGTEPRMELPEYNVDRRRYESHRHMSTPDGRPILSPFSNYICIWGYWNGPDERLAVADGQFVTGLNMMEACGRGILAEEEVPKLAAKKREKLIRAGFEDLNLKADHILISLDPQGGVIKDNAGKPQLRICNLDLFRRIPGTTSRPAAV